MVEKNEERTNKETDPFKLSMLKMVAVGGIAIAAAAGAYIATHDTRSPEDDPYSITLDGSIIARVDKSDVMVGAAGMGGLAFGGMAAYEMLLRSRESEE